MKSISRRITAGFLLLAMFLTSGMIPAFAESISDGNSKTVKISEGTRHEYLTSTSGNSLGGMAWSYKTNTGITGPAYCINHGLKAVPSNKELTIGGPYTANPKTTGAFATGYPQRSLEDFLDLYVPENPGLAGLTEAEYAYATQLAIWSTLGQLAVEGTTFNAGTATLAIPYSDAQKIRTYNAVRIILELADYWDQQLESGMHIRLDNDRITPLLDIAHRDGLHGAVDEGIYDLKKETINGTEYYTRPYIVSSATSTYKHGYFIDVWAENAPAGTLITGLDNVPFADNKVPVVVKYTGLNSNGSEYSGEFKLCIPAREVGDNGNITLHAYSTITQYKIYLANNPDHSEQSYVIADPLYAPMSCEATFKWTKVSPPYGRLIVHKVNDTGTPLAGAVFSLISTDGSSSFTGTSDANGLVSWDRLDPDKQYVLRETQAMEGYQIADPVNVSVPEGQTANVTVTNYSNRTFKIRKIDAQNGSPLLGATFRFEQVDGSYTTEVTTGHDGGIEFKGSELPFGTYKIFEKSAPAGYTKDTRVETITWDGKKDIVLNFSNIRTPSFTLIKIDAATNRSLSGAVFGIYKDGKLITTVTTNDAGMAKIPNVTEGYWEVEEQTAAKGYILDKTRHGIYINPYDPAAEADPVLVVSNKAKPGLKIIKYDRETMKPMPGVIFELFKDTLSIGTYTTDSRGEIVLTDLDEAVYTAKEIAADSSHIVNSYPQSIALTAGNTSTLVFFNDKKPNVRIIKVDSSTLDPLEGAVFTVSKIGGSFSQDFTTDRYGEIELTSLEPGAYEIREKSSASGYLNDATVRVINIEANQDATFVFTNTKEPTLELLKIDADTNKPLAGATFRIRRIGDGTVYYDRITGADGKISIKGLTPGVWSVQEIVSPAGFQLNDKEYHVELFAGQTSQIIVENKVKPSLKIIKLDNQSMKPMPGTVFEVWHDGSLVGTYTTDSKGEINLTGIPTGTYLVKEVATDSSHIVNSVPQQIEVKADSGNTAVLVFINQLKPGIRLLKLDSQTLKPMAGVRFRIEKVGGGFSKEFVTDDSGEIVLENMEPGAYQATELSAGPNHLIDDGVRVFQIEPDGNAVFVFTNTKRPGLIVWKYDKLTAKPLPNTEFSISYKGGEVIYEGLTGPEGFIRLENLDEKWVTVTELAPPPGYLLSEPVSRDVLLVGGRVTEIKFDNLKCPTLTLHKVDKTTGKPLEGVKFNVKYSPAADFTGGVIDMGTFITDANGKILLDDNLQAGWFRCTELATIPGYLMQDPVVQDISLKGGDNKTLVFENVKCPTLTIKKVDSVTGDPIAGVKFNVKFSPAENQDGSVTDLGTFTTDDAGLIIFNNNQLSGWYRCEEIETVSGYNMKAPTVQEVFLKAGDDKTLTFENIPKSALVIRKTDMLGMPVAGATFEIRYLAGTSGSGGTLIKTATTSANGTIVLTGLKAGTYICQETIPAFGFQIGLPSVQTAYISGLEQDVVELVFGNPKMGRLVITKLDSVTHLPVAGVTFLVTDSSGAVIGPNNGEYTTDETGVIEIDEWLKIGSTVNVKEIRGPVTHNMDAEPRSVKIAENTVHRLTFYNTPKSGLQIVKIDADTKKPLSHAWFTVHKKSGALIGEYETNADGIIFIENLDPQWVKIVETRCPEGYLLDETPKDVEITNNQFIKVVFENKKMGSLQIKKVNDVDGSPLAGAVFTVTKQNGEFVGEYTTGSDGLISIPMTPTWLIVTEKQSPKGFVLDSTPQIVEVKAALPTVVTFKNSPMPGLLIKKVDEQTKEPLSDVLFKVTDSAGTVIGSDGGEYKTDELGLVFIPDLEAGITLVVQESKAKDGYHLDDTVKTIVTEAGKQHFMEFYNLKLPSVYIKKTSADTKEPLSDVTFKVTDSSGAPAGDGNGEFRTDETGMIYVPNLKVGTTYFAREVKAKPGYVLDDTVQNFTTEAGKVYTLEFFNKLLPGILIKKMDSETKEPLSNVLFKVTDGKGTPIGENNGEYRTNEYGYIYIQGIAPSNNYFIHELQAKPGYTIENTVKTVYAEAGKLHTVEFFNKPLPGLLIVKLDAKTKTPLAGAVFSVTDANGNAIGGNKGQYTTDATGCIFIPDIKAGTGCFVKEIKTVDGYILDDTVQTVIAEAGKLHTMTFHNTPQPGLIIKKMDAVTKEPLSDVIFKVTYANGTVIGESNGEYRTDESGFVRISNINPGSVVVQELKTKSGYVLDNTPKTIEIEAGKLHSLDFYNTPLSSLTIKKMDAATKTPLADAIFKITTSDGQVVGSSNGEFRTDMDGLIVLYNLPASATLIIRELRAPDGYLLDDSSQTLKVEPNKAYTLDFYNKSLAALQIHKTDSVTGKPLGGAVFKVTKMNGEFVGEYTTTSDGFITIPEMDPCWLVISELRAPDGYIIDSTPKNVEIKTGKPVLVEFVNRPMSGLSIYKTDSTNGRPLGGARFSVTKMNGERIGEFTTASSGIANVGELEPGWYQIVETRSPSGYLIDSEPKNVEIKTSKPVMVTFENRPLSGLTITKLDEETRQPIRDVEFEVTKKNGERVGSYRTNSYGVINLNDIADGWYTVLETRAGKGYILDSRPRDVEVKNGKIADLVITNRKASSFLIHKVDSLTGKGIYGVSFLLSDALNNPIGTYRSDQNGYVLVDKTLSDGKYFWREIEAAPGYILDTTVKTFYVEYGATSEITWKNTPQQGQIQITKKSADANSINGFAAGTLLPGATFEIRNKAGNVVDTIVTDKNGWAASKPLPLGRYYVKESKSPAYYSLNDTTFEAELEFAGQIVRMEVLNKSIYTNVSVSKRGYTQASPSQSIRYDFRSIANNSTVPLESFYWRDTLPTDAVRLTKVITGTWNAKLSYKVVYRTNLSGDDYRTLADNLSTSKVYTLDASHAALGLASNECVTEFMFVFGTVPSGFSQVEAPYIFCETVSWLAHEYRFTNKTDVGGLWQGQWIMANDRWVTVIYNKPTPQKLPKTGY